MTQKVNYYCWIIDLGSLKLLTWQKMTFLAKWAPKWPSWSPSECGENLKIIEKCWNDFCWVYHGKMWCFYSLDLAYLAKYAKISHFHLFSIRFIYVLKGSKSHSAGELSFIIRMIFWNFGDGIIFSKSKRHDSKGWASDRKYAKLLLNSMFNTFEWEGHV